MRWHIFHERELDDEEKKDHPECEYVMDVDCTPGNGEEFLWYRKYSGSISIARWDDDLWTEYCDTEDGDPIEDGDAWMELPELPLTTDKREERLSGLYLEVRQKWNDMRVRKDTDTETLKFLVHLMDELEAL